MDVFEQSSDVFLIEIYQFCGCLDNGMWKIMQCFKNEFLNIDGIEGLSFFVETSHINWMFAPGRIIFFKLRQVSELSKINISVSVS